MVSNMSIPTYEDLYKLAYVAGSWTCPKCGFVLNKSTITPQGIGTTETDRQSEPCPNDGEWLTPTTYKEAAQGLHDRLVEELESNRDIAKSNLGLRNCRALAIKMQRVAGPNSPWDHILRYCEEGGARSSMLRSEGNIG